MLNKLPLEKVSLPDLRRRNTPLLLLENFAHFTQ